MPRKRTINADWWAKMTELDMQTGCRWWTGTKCRLGYGRMWFKGRSGYPAHRAAYEFAFGEFDTSLKVCHRCDNPTCVNPGHLFLGTQKDNLRDMFAKGRARPQGRVPRRLTTVAPAVASGELASVNSHVGVTTWDLIHLIRPEEEPADAVPPWCRVIGVPPVQPRQAVTLYKRPLEWTGNQQAGIPSGASLAECCESPVSSIRSVRKAGQR